MRMVAALVGLLPFFLVGCAGYAGPVPSEPPAADRPQQQPTYAGMHNLPSAHRITLGEGARVGILDHSFDRDAHPDLYSGAAGFRRRSQETPEGGATHRGYWMALSLHEVAPAAEIYALDTYTPDESDRVDAMVRAIDWAIAHELDVITSCAGGLSSASLSRLDAAVEKAVKAGVVVVFLDYAHPLNILPTGTGVRTQPPPRTPDVTILSDDCAVVFGDHQVAFLAADDDGLLERRPFLSARSTAPVAAGIVALVKSVNPDATPADVKQVLGAASRSLRVHGQVASRVPDAFEAVRRIKHKALPVPGA